MHSGEFTCPSMSAFTSELLTAQGIPEHTRHCKNDPFAVGTRACIGATNQSMCPVTALSGYLAIRLKRSGPLFIFHDGSTLSRERLVSSFRQVLSDVGVTRRSTAGTAFVLVLRLWQLSWVSPILSSRRWADGNCPYLCTTFALCGSSWQASHRG